jgi:hypothetical protein
LRADISPRKAMRGQRSPCIETRIDGMRVRSVFRIDPDISLVRITIAFALVAAEAFGSVRDAPQPANTQQTTSCGKTHDAILAK